MRRKLIGRKLKLARKAAGLPLRHPDIVDAVGSTRTAQRLEDGEATQLTYPVIGTLCDLYEMPAEEKFELQRLWRLGPDATTWTQPRGKSLFGFEALRELQLQTSEIRQYESTFVPGPLQAHTYMKMLFKRNPKLTDAQANAEVDLRSQNQAPFWEPGGPQQYYLLSESILRMGCDSEQINRLIEADSLDHMTVRYLPFASGPPSLLYLPFMLLSFPANHDSDVVYVEAQDAHLYFEEAETVRYYRAVLAPVWDQARTIREFKV